MSQEISITLDLKSAEALQKLSAFVDQASSGLMHLAEKAAALYLSFEGLKKLEDGVQEAIKLEAAIGGLATKTGLAVETVVAMRDAATKSGVEFEKLSFGLVNFNAKVYEAVTSGGKAAEMFTQMHIALLNQDGTLKATDEILLAFLERFKELPSAQQKTAFAMELFGKAGRDLITVLNNGAGAIEEVKRVGSPITTETVLQSKDFLRSMRELHEAVEMVWVRIANALLPTLQRFINSLKSINLTEFAASIGAVVEGFMQAFREGRLPELLGDALKLALDGVLAYAPSVFERLGYMLLRAFQTPLNYLQAGLIYIVDHIVNNEKLGAFIGALPGGNVAKAALMANGLYTGKPMTWEEAQAEQAKTGLRFNLGSGEFGLDEMEADAKARFAVANSDFLKQLDAFMEKVHSFASRTLRPEMMTSDGNDLWAPPTNSQTVSLMGELNRLMDETWKQQAKLIEQSQELTNPQKYERLLPLIQKQIDLWAQEWEAMRKIKDDPNTKEEDRIKAAKELLRLQAEYNGLLTKMANFAPESFFVALHRNVVQMVNTWGNVATTLTNGAFSVITQGIHGMANALTAVIMGTESAGQAFAQLGISLATSFIEMILESLLYAYIAIPVLAALDTLMGGAPAASGSTTTIVAMATTMSAVGGMVAAREFGGPVQAGHPYIVGERRPELFIPDQNGVILPSVPSPVAPGGAGFGGGSPEVKVILGIHGGEAAAKKWVQSQDGHGVILDMNKKMVRRYSRA